MDPALELYRKELVMEAGRKLDKARMIRFEERTGYFASTDLGRTASHFYIKYNTIEVDPPPHQSQDLCKDTTSKGFSVIFNTVGDFLKFQCVQSFLIYDCYIGKSFTHFP